MITKATYIYPRTLRMRMQLRILNCYDSDPGFDHNHRRGRRGGERREEQEEEERGREGERQQALDVDSVLQNRTTGGRYSILDWWGSFLMAMGTKLVSSFSSGFLLCPRTLPLVDLRVSVYVTASLGSYLGKTMPSEGKCLKILFTQKKRSCNIN